MLRIAATLRLAWCIATDERQSWNASRIDCSCLLDSCRGRDCGALRRRKSRFRCHGLEFARARLMQQSGSFRIRCTEIVFGSGSRRKSASARKMPREFADLVRSVGEVRHPEGPRDHPLWRLHPERWLEIAGRAECECGRRAARCQRPCIRRCRLFQLPIAPCSTC